MHFCMSEIASSSSFSSLCDWFSDVWECVRWLWCQQKRRIRRIYTSASSSNMLTISSSKNASMRFSWEMWWIENDRFFSLTKLLRFWMFSNCCEFSSSLVCLHSQCEQLIWESRQRANDEQCDFVEIRWAKNAFLSVFLRTDNFETHATMRWANDRVWDDSETWLWRAILEFVLMKRGENRNLRCQNFKVANEVLHVWIINKINKLEFSARLSKNIKISTSQKALTFRPDNYIKCRSFWVILADIESAWSAQ
jgi:hypothetical protein